MSNYHILAGDVSGNTFRVVGNQSGQALTATGTDQIVTVMPLIATVW